MIAADRARDPGLRTRFSLEARLAAAIDHPNLVPVHAAGEEDGRLYLVMRYVDGTDLHRCLKRDGPLAPARAARVVSQVAAGLDAAHAAGLVHRDVKPANVLLSGEHVYLGDFGLSRLQAAERADHRERRLGRHRRLHVARAPARRAVRRPLGRLRARLRAVRGADRRAAVPARHRPADDERAPAPAAAAPVGPRAGAGRVRPRVERALAKRPEDRYPSAGDLGRAALAAAAGEPVTEQERTVATGAAAPADADDRDADRAPRRPSPRRPTWQPPEHAPALKRARAPGRRAAARSALLAVAAISASVAAVMLVARRRHRRRGHASSPSGEVRDAADAFADAIASEDAGALSRVLARDVKRVFPGDSQRGRAAVLATYRGQFRGNEITGYDLSDLDVSGGPRRARRGPLRAAPRRPDADGRRRSCSASSGSAGARRWR